MGPLAARHGLPASSPSTQSTIASAIRGGWRCGLGGTSGWLALAKVDAGAGDRYRSRQAVVIRARQLARVQLEHLGPVAEDSRSRPANRVEVDWLRAGTSPHPLPGLKSPSVYFASSSTKGGGSLIISQ